MTTQLVLCRRAAIMANPRKFSEKIALHNQKQAEETAAFEQIMKEVSGATRATAGAQYQKMQMAQALGAYRGGSLPNVNQIGTGAIDLQGALHSLEDIKRGAQPGFVDRRPGFDRRMLAAQHRNRLAPFEKRQMDSPRYGGVHYLSPPDTNWRSHLHPVLPGSAMLRTNSDSALHTSAMNPAPQDPFHPQNQGSPQQVRRFGNVLDPQLGQKPWDPKKHQQVGTGRPKSCEVPGISIYPSAEQETNHPHIPISNNTGSLPDLTNLQFPSPLATPLDVEDQTSFNHSSGNTLSTNTMQHLGINAAQQTQTSPQAQRRRHTHHSAPSPLTLSPHQQRRAQSQVIPPHNEYDRPDVAHQGFLDTQVDGSILNYPLDFETLTVDTAGNLTVDPQAQLRQFQLFQQQQSAQQPPGPPPQRHSPSPQHTPSPHQSPQHMPQHHQQQFNMDVVMQQYRSQPSGVASGPPTPTSQSPSSPLSNQTYSLSQSPQGAESPISSMPNTIFSESYYLQQQQQTNALQHQFEQFSMVQDNPSSSPLTTSSMSPITSNPYMGQTMSDMQYAQAQIHGLTGSQEFLQPNNNNKVPPYPHSSQGNQGIPDIILTGAGESPPRQDFAKDLGSAMASMASGFDSDTLFAADDPLKVGIDPLDLESLQMLTEPSDMVADPATEDSFRMDRL
ncbi:CREB-regulated transcription coactivator 1-like isoform X2 [Branchiostoma lanceolatum]|uniref:CREB-regulated transcription coactivator 1-like isoform X2 n=1 Tax=Branchiostoma lanceolatum TaxID=7740 RepID=UPI003452ABE4